MRLNLSDKRKREIATLAIVFSVVLLLSAAVAYFIAGRSTQSVSTRDAQVPVATPRDPTTGGVSREPVEPRPSTQNRGAESPGFVEQLFGTGGTNGFDPDAHWTTNAVTISFRLLLAAMLGAALAFRPRQRIRAVKQNPYVSQTQILLAIVAAALMIIVGDNAARAFGIFAAVSLVRFRTNIRDPKEITVLLISLALGLAAGVGRYELALILVVFAFLVLWVLEWREPSLVFRSLVLKISSQNVAATQHALRKVFRDHGFDSELRGLEQEHEGSPGSILYSVDVNPSVSTDQLSEDILSLDDHHIQSIEWEQKKSYSYLYQ